MANRYDDRGGDDRGLWKRILVPTDFSETAVAATKYAVVLTRGFNAHLVLMHVADHREFEVLVERQRVVDQTLAEIDPTLLPVEPTATLQRAARELLAPMLKPQEQQELSVEYVLLDRGSRGSHAEILGYAAAQNIDLIVIGTHGRGRLVEILIGGIAEHVVRSAPCPVLTVRHPKHEFVMPDEQPTMRQISAK